MVIACVRCQLGFGIVVHAFVKGVLRFEQRNLQIEGNNSTCLGNVVEGSMMLFGMHAGHLFVGGGERDQVELSQALPQEENKL
jgi:hypothetical protein